MPKSDLKTLIPTEEVETSAGVIKLYPFKFKDFPKALALVGKYVDLIAETQSTAEVVRKILSGGGEETLADVSNLISLASGKDPDCLQDLGWDEVFNLLLIIVEQNVDFFFRAGERLGSLGKKDPKPTDLELTGTGEAPSAS